MNSDPITVLFRPFSGKFRWFFAPSNQCELFSRTSSDDAELEACRRLDIFDLLDLCKKWDEDCYISNISSCNQAVENVLTAWRKFDRLELEQGGTLPHGLVDFFNSDLQSSIDSLDSLKRLHAAVKLKRMPKVSDLGSIPAWPDRLLARLANPKLAAIPDHVQWISLADNIVDSLILTTTAEGTPAERHELLNIRNRYASSGSPHAPINCSLAEVLIAFQNYFQSAVPVRVTAQT